MNPLNIIRQPTAGQAQTLYDERFIAPMREELVGIGFEEMRTGAQVDEQLRNSTGTLLVVVNSMCGCAAGRARPGIALALRSGVLPQRLATVFAGQDPEATARARSYLEGQPPSSPSVALFKDGKLVFMMHRREIEGRDAPEIAQHLVEAFETHCG